MTGPGHLAMRLPRAMHLGTQPMNERLPMRSRRDPIEAQVNFKGYDWTGSDALGYQ